MTQLPSVWRRGLRKIERETWHTDTHWLMRWDDGTWSYGDIGCDASAARTSLWLCLAVHDVLSRQSSIDVAGHVLELRRLDHYDGAGGELSRDPADERWRAAHGTDVQWGSLQECIAWLADQLEET